MSTPNNAISDQIENLTDDAQTLLATTADLAGEKVAKARNRLMDTLAAAKDSCAAAQEKAIQSAKAADKVIRANPYQAIGAALLIGVAVGFLIRSRNK